MAIEILHRQNAVDIMQTVASGLDISFKVVSKAGQHIELIEDLLQ